MTTYMHGIMGVAIAGLLAGGCVTAGGGALENGGCVTGSQAHVKVQNFNWADMTIYAMDGGKPTRLGTVVSMTSRTFELPETFSVTGSSATLRARGIGCGARYETEKIVVERGDRIDLVLENNLAHSTYAVRNGGIR